MFKLKYTVTAMTGCVAVLWSLHALACATCGCSLVNDGITGYLSSSGWRVNVDAVYLNQDGLRHGNDYVSSSSVAAINNAGGSQEVEHQTLNRYYNVAVTYAPSAEWNFKAIVPYVDRYHTTYGNATTSDLTPANLDSANASGIGDTKLFANYQGLLPKHNLGLQLGIKVPTGNYGGQNVNNGNIVGSPVRFKSGNVLDTSLQQGTGTTDLIIGGYYYQAVSQNVDAFFNGQYQFAVAQKLDQAGADYRQGNQLYLNGGLRYLGLGKVVPQLQLNLIHKAHDQGALADVNNSEGSTIYISPGFNANITKEIQAYSFLQVPVHSNLSGYQLFPKWVATVGVAYTFR